MAIRRIALAKSGPDEARIKVGLWDGVAKSEPAKLGAFKDGISSSASPSAIVL